MDTFQASWALSSIDQTHRLVAAYSVDLPFGRGKHWLNHTSTPALKALDGAIGGWEVSGISTYRSGTPLFFGASNSNTNNSIKVETTFGSYTSGDHNLTNSAYMGDSQVLASPTTPIGVGTIRRFDSTKLTNAASFTYRQTDLSLMKKFSLFAADGHRFLQVRAEAQNAFNIRGFGTYNTTISSTNFGLITAAGNTERHIQLSARIE